MSSQSLQWFSLPCHWISENKDNHLSSSEDLFPRIWKLSIGFRCVLCYIEGICTSDSKNQSKKGITTLYLSWLEHSTAFKASGRKTMRKESRVVGNWSYKIALLLSCLCSCSVEDLLFAWPLYFCHLHPLCLASNILDWPSHQKNQSLVKGRPPASQVWGKGPGRWRVVAWFVVLARREFLRWNWNELR